MYSKNENCETNSDKVGIGKKNKNTEMRKNEVRIAGYKLGIESYKL